MTTTQKRKQVSEFLNKKADERFINMVYAMMLEYAHALKPMTEEEFYIRNQKSQKDIRNNKVYSQEEVKKRFAAKKILM